MSTPNDSLKQNPDDQLKCIGVLWEEYKYRHDLCWRVIFRLTSAIVVLAIVPYIYEEVVRSLRAWILLVPGLAVGLVIFGAVLIKNELDALQRVKDEYRELQKKRLYIEQHGNDKIRFRTLVYVYFGTLFLLSINNFCVVFRQLYLAA